MRLLVDCTALAHIVHAVILTSDQHMMTFAMSSIVESVSVPESLNV